MYIVCFINAQRKIDNRFRLIHKTKHLKLFDDLVGSDRTFGGDKRATY
jgi:hypothetical protein